MAGSLIYENQVVIILHNPKIEQIIKTVYFNPFILKDYFFKCDCPIYGDMKDASNSPLNLNQLQLGFQYFLGQ